MSEPIVSSCIAGQLRDAERQSVLAKLNAVRARHGLLPVSYDASQDLAAADAALYMVANQKLTHAPDASGKCFSNNAYAIASTGNLHLMWGSFSTRSTPSADAVVGYLIDKDVASLGHRRWVLHPFLGKTTYGRVDGPADGGAYYMASVLKVMGNDVANISAMSNDFVAYPYGTYPAGEFRADWFLSFSAIASKTDRWANGASQVSYANATITVLDNNNQSLAVSSQSANYEGYGVANHLQWKVAGLTNNIDYSVRITNVLINGSPRDFQYSFRLQ